MQGHTLSPDPINSSSRTTNALSKISTDD